MHSGALRSPIPDYILPPPHITMEYLTIQSPSEAVFTEQRSKFLAFAHPVSCADEAKLIVKEYDRRFHDARHVCWAYMVGASRTDFLSTDNGEPSGTAGKPILGQINSFRLTNIIIVVVRYFGGIKLGTSGLIAAYRQAARMAIEASTIVERHEMGDISFSFPFESTNSVMKLIKANSLTITSQTFNNLCSISLSVPLSDITDIRNRLAKIDGVCIL